MGRNKQLVAVVSFIAVASFAAGAVWGKTTAKKKEPVIVMPADVKWEPLDPKAGAAGPQFAVVFGDMKKKAPLGMFMKFPGDFKPGLHTHSSDYYAVPITGTMHNWLDGQPEGAGVGSGGYWMQPGKVPHDNHCAGKTGCSAFVYFPKGFDFKPAKAAGAPADPAKKP